MNCSICEVFIEPRDSCNAEPLNSGRCCQACDDLIVTPVRILAARGWHGVVDEFQRAVEVRAAMLKIRKEAQIEKTQTT